MSSAVAHPLIVPLPRVLPPVNHVVRWALLARLRSVWAGGRLDLVLPSGEVERLGSLGPADATAHVHDERMFLRLLLRGEMGGGESFVAGEWSSDDLVAVLRVFIRGTAALGAESPLTRIAQLGALVKHRLADNSRTGSERNIHAHYDLGNDFYATFLDAETLAYSAAIFSDAQLAGFARESPLELEDRPPIEEDILADAQGAKFERLCDQLALSSSDHLLEIGCGWGGMAIHAAQTRGCRVTAITVSREQHDLATKRVASAGLSDRVEIQYRDYRDLTGTYDKVVSIEMLEAVGYEYLPSFFSTCARVLKPGGSLALQSITMPDDRFAAYRGRVDWMQTYIFPGSCIPSIAVIRSMAARAGLRVTDTHDIGPSYAVTLRAWRERFTAALPTVRALGFDEPFIRTWMMYLSFSEAAFAERTLMDHQLLLVR
ncbi:MAG TPA: cyclopropane-fatty-acyl-phospholipid synthase family protein [Kofleriaceae bacterium]